MDYPCHKCRQPVEEGTPFCSHCGAPQIRVAIPESVPVAVPATAGDDPFPSPSLAPASSGVPPVFLPVQWPRAVQPCALGALFAVALMCLGLNAFVAVLGAGFLSVVLYRQRNPGTAVRPGTGARLGALGGLFFFGLSTIVAAVVLAFSHKAADFRTQILVAMQQNAANYPADQVQHALDFMKSPAGFTFFMVVALIFGFVVFVVLGTLGGALAGAVLGRQRRP